MFGNSMFGGMDQDPFYAMHRQQMNMMSMDPFAGLMGRPPAAVPQIQHHQRSRGANRHNQLAQQPPPMMGTDMFSHMNQMMGSMNHMMSNMHSQMQMANMQPHAQMAAMQRPMMQAGQSGAPVYSHQTVMSFSSDGSGQPQVYEESQTTTNAGNGMRETKRTVRDSEQGIAKMAIDRQIGDRRHQITKQKNLRTGELEENQDYDNLDEEEADAFHAEFQQRAARPQRHQRAITGQRHSPHHRPSHSHRHSQPPRSSSSSQHQYRDRE